MADESELLTFLKETGSVFLGKTGSGHQSWRLPNNKKFVFASTPSSPRSYTESLGQLRRMLEGIIPAALQLRRGNYTPSKDRINSLAAALASKGIIAQEVMALPEAEFEIVSDETFEVQIRIETPVEPTVIKPRFPTTVERKLRVEKAQVKHLTTQQLAEANRILHSLGDAAMSQYINSCRHNLVTYAPPPLPPPVVSIEEAPVQSQNTTDPNVEDEMSHLFDRARKELASADEHLSKNNDRIVAIELERLQLVDDNETLEAKKLELHDFIALQDKLLAMTPDILKILPEEVIVPVAEVATKNKIGGKKSADHIIGIKEVREYGYPKLLELEKFTFRVDDLYPILSDYYGADRMPKANTIHAAVFGDVNAKIGWITKEGPGTFRFKEQYIPAEAVVTPALVVDTKPEPALELVLEPTPEPVKEHTKTSPIPIRSHHKKNVPGKVAKKQEKKRA